MMYAENLLLCVAVPLCVSLLFLKGNARRFCLFLILGMIICLLSAYINSYLMVAFGLNVDEAAVYLTPMCEECMKLIPILCYFLIYDPPADHLIIASITIGVGFATLENGCYLLMGGVSEVSYVLVRGAAAGIMHAVCALTIGIGLVILKNVRNMAAIGALGIFACIVTYHSLYNLLVSASGLPRAIGYMIPMITIIIYYLRLRKYMKNWN